MERGESEAVLQSKGVLHPTESKMSKPREQQRPSGKEGVHPFEIATAAALNENIRVRESLMMRKITFYQTEWPQRSEEQR